MYNDEYFNSYMASVTSSRAIIRSTMSILERQDAMLRTMYLDRRELYEEEPAPTPISLPAHFQRRPVRLDTNGSAYRTAMGHTVQSPLNTRFYRENNRMPQNSPPIRSRNLDNNNQSNDNSIANIFAEAILNSIGNMNQLSPVIVRPSQRTIELATENILFSDIPPSIDRYQQCPISHDNFQANTPITRIRRCGHYFERESIATWFQNSSRCPICRADIRDGITDDTAHNNEVINESDEPVNNPDDNNGTENDVAGNTNEINNIANVEINQSISDILGIISSPDEASDFPGATISYQLELVPVVQNDPSPTSDSTSRTFANSLNMFRRARNNRAVGVHRTSFSGFDPSGNNFS